MNYKYKILNDEIEKLTAVLTVRRLPEYIKTYLRNELEEAKAERNLILEENRGVIW